MPKIMTVLLLGCAAGATGWWFHGPSSGAGSIKARAESLPAFILPDPIWAEIDAMPDGSRVIAAVEKARTVPDLLKLVAGVQLEVDKTKAAVTAVRSFHSASSTSCDSNLMRTQAAIATAIDKGEQLKAALGEVEPWIQRSIAKVRVAVASEASALEPEYQKFQHRRLEIEQAIATIQSLGDAIPVLRKANCEVVELPRFREEAE